MIKLCQCRNRLQSKVLGNAENFQKSREISENPLTRNRAEWQNFLEDKKKEPDEGAGRMEKDKTNEVRPIERKDFSHGKI